MQLIYLVLIGCSLAAALQEKEIQQEWLKFKQNKGKSYRNILEDNKRYRHFRENLEIIVEHNKLYENGEVSYKMGLNEYSDMDFNEIENTLMGIKINGSDQENLPNAEIFVSSLPTPSLPSSVDWRHSGAVTKVKNQGSCGSCWAFAATGALESHQYLKTKKTVLLSEQNLVDCETQSNGCSGGHTYLAFEYIKRNGGINTEQSYPYTGKQGKCNFKRESVGATCNGYVQLPYGKENSLQEAVATKGPIAVYVHATSAFMKYKNGIFDDKTCTTNINHAVLVVGYGRENGRDYWLVKNSWGTGWGEKGYIKMSRNRNNQCGIGTWSYYPKV